MTRLSLLASTAAALAIAAIAGSARANAASFNCNAHLSYTEKAICDNPGLSNADDQLASLYYGVLNSAGPGVRQAIERREYAWLGQRNSCGANVRCLWQAYRGRIQTLNEAGAY